MTIKKINIRGKEFLSDAGKGVAPYFTNELLRRVGNKEATNILVTGEAGSSKSYTGINIARNIDPKFSVGKQIVFDFAGYYEALLNLKMGQPIVFDEPSYSLSAREWYQDINRALVKTMESQRSLVIPLIIPIINANLIDKTIRMYLIQFHVHMTSHGLGTVYRLRASQYESKVYRYTLCRIRYGLMDNDKCDRDSCLDCKKLKECPLCRAAYERKKRIFQERRYTQDKEQAQQRESQRLTMKQICELAYPHRELFTNQDKLIDVKKLRIVLRDKEETTVGYNKTYHLRTELQMRYPQDFKPRQN